MSQIKIVIFILLVTILNYACHKKCEVKECKGTIIDTLTVSGGVSGGRGTHITPDSIFEVTSQSAVIGFKVVSEGACHKIIGHGHVWSAIDATPTLENASLKDYGDNVNFMDDIKTTMDSLLPATRYYVRSWIAVEISNCDRTREVMYNDNITEFTTNP